MSDLKRPLACWKKPTTDAKLIKDIDRILKDMVDNTPGVLPVATTGKTLAQCKLDNGDFNDKQTIALTRVPGSAGIRDGAKDISVININDKKGWIQSLMDNAPDFATKVAICTASGFRLKVNGKWFKPPFEAKQGTTGEAILVQISGGPNTFYEWRMSTTPGLVKVYDYLAIPSNLVDTTSKTDLVIGTNYWFSGRKTTRTKKKEITTDWTADVLFNPKSIS